jgi:hypothetical protein
VAADPSLVGVFAAAGFLDDLEAAARAAFFRRAVFAFGAERFAAVRFFAAGLVAGLAGDRRGPDVLAVERLAAARPAVFFALERLVVAFRDTRFATLPPVKSDRTSTCHGSTTLVERHTSERTPSNQNPPAVSNDARGSRCDRWTEVRRLCRRALAAPG